MTACSANASAATWRAVNTGLTNTEVSALAVDPTNSVCGDVDGSGSVTVTDGVQVLRAAAGLSSTCTPSVCDVDRSGQVGVSDGVNVLREAAGLSSICSSVDVRVVVDASVTHQTIEGFGATTISLAHDRTDNVPMELRTQAIDALYGQVKLNMGNLAIFPFEAPVGNLYAPANDDNSPATFNLGAFNWTQSDNMMQKVVMPGRALGFDNFFIGPAIGLTYEFAWAKALRQSNYARYLDECAEHVAALAIHWRDAYGITPPLMMLWNEPIGGNGELVGGSRQELVDIVKAAGARLRKEGFASMKFVVPADETEQLSLDEAAAILADAAARPFVGAIAYHPYPYGSTYASVPNILATSGAGRPDATKVAVRNRLRDLGKQYGVPTFMVEVSHSEVPFGDFRGLRGRAIEIHDEFVYADAAAFFGMTAMWDTVTNDAHYAGRNNPGLFFQTDTVVLIDDTPNQPGRVYITEMGHAIGHYARWIPRGSVRLEATSDDALVQVTAFRDVNSSRLVLVAINNAPISRTLNIEVGGASLDAAKAVVGEQSTAGAIWQALEGPRPQAGGFTLVLPALSVTSIASGLAGPADAGAIASAATGGNSAGCRMGRGTTAGPVWPWRSSSSQSSLVAGIERAAEVTNRSQALHH